MEGGRRVWKKQEEGYKMRRKGMNGGISAWKEENRHGRRNKKGDFKLITSQNF